MFSSLLPNGSLGRLFLVGAALSTWALLTVDASLSERFPGDLRATVWVQAFQARWFDELMRGMSAIGTVEPMLMLVLSAALVLYARAHRIHLWTLVLAASVATSVPVLKSLIERPRPNGDFVDVLASSSGYSFPSGHAFMAITIFGALFYLSPHICGPRPWAILAMRALTGALILGIGLSRVYLGVHWTSDVIGGYLFGGLALFAVVLVMDQWAHRRRSQPSPS